MYLIPDKKSYFFFIAILEMAFLLLSGSAYASDQQYIEKIHLEKNPFRMHIYLTDKPVYRVFQNDKKEVLVAFKQTAVSKNLITSGDGKPFIKSISLEKLPGDILSFVISTDGDLRQVESSWNSQANRLTVTLGPDVLLTKKTTPKKTSPKIQKKSVKEKVKEERLDEEKRASAPVKTKYNGVFEDFFLEFEDSDCVKNEVLAQGLKDGSKKEWKKCFNVLNNYLEENSSGECQEQMGLLRGYAYFKSNETENDPETNLKIIEYFQNFISYHPESSFLAYALMGMGNTYLRLGNKTEAKGYYKLIKKDYPKFNGMPQVILFLGRIYNDSSRPKQAIAVFKEGVKRYPYSSVYTDTLIELGKAYFNSKNYKETISVLLKVVESNPKLIYEKEDLLIYIGNSYYYTGKNKEAREYLGKVYNLFPETELNHEYLTKIGDTYKEEKEEEKAIEIYRLVIEKYPKSSGYVLSTMRLADLTKDQEEKEKLYQLIISEFPEHMLYNIAMLRLAQLYDKQERYLECIAMIKKLLESGTRALKKDALSLMQKATISLFKNYLESDEYPKVLAHFETEKETIDKFKDPELFYLVGNAYFEGHLYDQAYENFIKSKELYLKRKKPAELVLHLAISMQEKGLQDDALNTYNEFIQNYPGNAKISNANFRKGNLLYDKAEHSKAIASYREAFKTSDNNEEKVRILLAEAKAHKALENYKTVSLLLERAIAILASDPYDDFNTIFLVHRNLGENYMKLKSYIKAAEAFNMALKIADREKGNADIYFMLGDAYQKSDAVEKAVKAFEDAIKTGDVFWSKLAQERLNEIKVEKKLQKA